MKTTGKLHIPVGALKEVVLKFLYQIVNYIENYRIPRSLIVNFDQTPTKYVQTSSMTTEKGGETNVSISGINDNLSLLRFPSFWITSFYPCS